MPRESAPGVEAAPEIVAGAANLNLSQQGVCFEFPNLTKVDILLTYRCNAACVHCITRSHPRRTESLAEAEIRELLAAGADAGKRYTSFTGGEPFLDFPLLLRLVAYASRLGYYVCADTNAFWGVSERKAHDWATRLRDAGIDAVFPSADSYHLPFVSLDRVKRVVAACDRVGIPCEINFSPGPDPAENEHILTELGLRNRGFFNDGLSLTGNDVTHLLHLFPQLLAAEMDDTGSMHMGVGARGDVYANVDISDTGDEYSGSPLVLGDLRAGGAAAALRVERERPLLAVTRTKGPREVDAYLQSRDDLADQYLEEMGGRRFYSPTEFFLALFHAPGSQRYSDALTEWGGELAADELAAMEQASGGSSRQAAQAFPEGTSDERR